MSATSHTPIDLSGKLLIAMPNLQDVRFQYAVIYICTHSPQGTMGLILNKPIPDVTLQDMLTQLKIDTTSPPKANTIFYGGPVDGTQGFVLHSNDYDNQTSTLQINEQFSMTATRDVLEDMAAKNGPEKTLSALGYTGWSPGQLESELQENAWLTCDASFALVFETQDDQKWAQALATLGVNPLLLSAQGGTA